MEQQKNHFEYQKPTDKSTETIKSFRQECKELSEFIIQNIPNCRERSVALTKLEEVSMWGNKAIVFNQDEE